VGLTREVSHLWGSDPNSFVIRKMQTSGIQVGYFTINDNHIRDLAWDGNYIWAINTSGTMKKFTVDGVLVESISELLRGGWGLTYGDGYLWASDPDNDMIYKIATVTGVEDEGKYAFEKLYLFQNYPNPFSQFTVINYSIGSNGQISENRKQTTERKYVVLEVYELTGRLVKTLVNEFQSSGSYSVYWDGTNEADLRVVPGIYFYSLRFEDFNMTKKMIIVR